MKFTAPDYRRYVMMSHRRHILVEGRDDKRLMSVLLHEVLGRGHEVDVNSAQDLHQVGVGGNRDVVEEISRSISDKPYAHRYVGFVDREYRGFALQPELRDDIQAHHVEDRLIWTRGHSSENYLFDFAVLKQPLRAFSITEQYDLALDLFEQAFESALRLACVISLVSSEMLDQGVINALQVLKNVIDWNCLDVNGEAVSLRMKVFTEQLHRLMKLDEERIASITGSILRWQPSVERADFNVVRWLCHGHIGLSILWSVYGACVYRVCCTTGTEKPNDEVKKVLKAAEAVRFNACLDHWCCNALHNRCEYPAAVFSLLGFGAVSLGQRA